MLTISGARLCEKVSPNVSLI